MEFENALFLLATAIVLSGTWAVLRLRSGVEAFAQVPLDVAPLILGWALLYSVSRRPLLSAIAIFAMGIGLAFADFAKRDTLREPLVFADRAELLEVVRHPSLYLPFAGPLRIVGGAIAAIVAVAALAWAEPARGALSPVLPLLLVALLVLLHTQPPFLARVARYYRAKGVSTDPEQDMRRFGFLACLVMHATIARDERGWRRGAVPARPDVVNAADAPVVLVQIESFFDARRLGKAAAGLRLPGYDRLVAEAAQSGRLVVPCWGANTVRTEFEALTGIGQEALGLDRFNPYDRFAKQPLPSLAWQLKRAGWRTIGLHPFDKSFYARDKVLPCLGFDEFRGLEEFPGRGGHRGWVPDEDVGRATARLLQSEGPRVFIFAITMGNHGPWPGADGLATFLDGIAGSDRMLSLLMDAMPPGGILAIYGDHQPCLPEALAEAGVRDAHTDYAIWQAGTPARHESRPGVTIAAKDLPDAILRLCARPVRRLVPDEAVSGSR